MAHRHRGDARVLPCLDVQVGATDTGTRNRDGDLARAGHGFGALAQLNVSRTRPQLRQPLHGCLPSSSAARLQIPGTAPGCGREVSDMV
jgi:hypothetical protein